MRSDPKAPIDTWFRNEKEEEGMYEDHAYLWRHLIDAMREKDLSQACVLDYGCNRGGFLDTLYRRHQYRNGIGVDVAELSLAIARKHYSHLPVEFLLPRQLDIAAGSVDIAFSHEVLYLLPDLPAHAALVAQSLKQGGVYYAAIGCHTANPLWKRWHGLITETTKLPVFDYSLDDFGNAFRDAGLKIEMRPFAYDDFVLIKPNNAYFPQAIDSLDYHARVKTIIRASKGG